MAHKSKEFIATTSDSDAEDRQPNAKVRPLARSVLPGPHHTSFPNAPGRRAIADQPALNYLCSATKRAKVEQKNKESKKVKKASSDEEDGGHSGPDEASGAGTGAGARAGGLSRDGDGKEFLLLAGKTRRVTISQFKGQTLIDIREVTRSSPSPRLLNRVGG